jgi:elongator complex protein 2
LPGHDNWIRSLQFATYTEGSEDATSKAFNHTLRRNDLILASGSQDKYIRLWKVSPEESSNHQASATHAQPATHGGDGSTLTKDMLEALEESVKYVSLIIYIYHILNSLYLFFQISTQDWRKHATEY